MFDVFSLFRLYLSQEMLELTAMIVMDEEFKSAAAEETLQYQKDVRALELKVINLIVPKDKDDSHDAILEIRAASGGREAAIFAMEMFTMYSKFCTWKNWKFDLLSKSENSEGGLKDASASVIGKDVFSFLKVRLDSSFLLNFNKMLEKKIIIFFYSFFKKFYTTWNPKSSYKNNTTYTN